MKKVAVILAGCGRDDGSEISESILTLLAIDRAGAKYQCFAPNVEQYRVVDHYTDKITTEKRNVLVEAARIARGDIKPLESANAEEYDAAILPGGYGAALNLSDFALKGTDCEIVASVKHFIQDFAKAGKPVGFICIAPALISKIYGAGVTHTIGTDKDTASAIEKMGGKHQNCAAEDCVVDNPHKVVSTPAYMLANSIKEAAAGIEKLVHEVLKMA